MGNAKLSALRARIDARCARLKSEHRGPEPTIAEARAELAGLGPYIRGEPRKRSLRRARLQRLMVGKPGVYSDPSPLPGSIADMRCALEELGAFVMGEPGRMSRRRAAIERALGLALLPDSIAEPESRRHAQGAPGKRGVYNDPDPLPDSVAGMRDALEELGEHVVGEPGSKSRRRAHIERALSTALMPDSVAGMRGALEELGPHVVGESGRKSRRRAHIKRALQELSPPPPELSEPPPVMSEPDKARLRAHMRCALQELGPPVMVEPGDKSRRRADIERALYYDPGPLPDSVAGMRGALQELGPYVLGESRRKAQRRAHIERALQELSEPEPVMSEPGPLPDSLAGMRDALQELGAPVMGESWNKSRRRAHIERALGMAHCPTR